MIVFVFINALNAYNFVWVTLITGPLFLIASYFELVKLTEIEFEQTGVVENNFGLRIMRAIIITLASIIGHYLQNRDYRIVIVK